MSSESLSHAASVNLKPPIVEDTAGHGSPADAVYAHLVAVDEAIGSGPPTARAFAALACVAVLCRQGGRHIEAALAAGGRS